MRKLLLAAIAVLVIVPAAATASHGKSKSDGDVRFATFNLSLNRGSAGLLLEHRGRYRLRPEQLRRPRHDAGRAGLRRRLVRLRGVPGPVRDGRVFEASD